MSAPELTVIEDIRPLIALVAPLIGLIGIVWAGEKKKKSTGDLHFSSCYCSGVCGLINGTLIIRRWNY